jgi:curved DNA-binding protein CbpA
VKKKDSERRCFTRYKKKSPARVIKEKEPHQVEIFDYSLNGVGLILEGSLPINRGDVVRINNDDLSLNATCEVKWLSKTSSGFKIGLHRLDEMKGFLKDYRLSDIFIGLQRSLKTGILSVTSGTAEKRIYIKNGDLIFAGSNQNEDRLGDILLREGLITQEHFDLSSKLIPTTGKRQGAILVEMGAVTPKQLFDGVKRQVTEIILSLFSFENGEFIFQERLLPTEEVITLKLSAGNLIYQGVKRLTCIEQVREYLDLPPETALAFSEDPLNLYQDISFDEDDKRIISFIDGRRPLKDIISLSGLYEPKVRRSLSALLSTTVIEVMAGKEVEITVTPEDVISKPADEPGIVEEIGKMFHQFRGLTYYALLGVEEYASGAEIRSAFYRLAKEYHPDRHFYLGEDIKGKLHEIFTHITNAYTVLSSPEKREEYNRSLSQGQTTDTGTGLARQKFDEGRGEYAKGNFENAVRWFAEAAYLDHSVAAYHLFYGLALARLQKLKEAERAMTKAHRLDPRNDEILAELGHLYHALGFPLRAQRSFKKALELNSENQRAREGLT